MELDEDDDERAWREWGANWTVDKIMYKECPVNVGEL
jgi:hypothetical protein